MSPGVINPLNDTAFAVENHNSPHYFNFDSPKYIKDNLKSTISTRNNNLP